MNSLKNLTLDTNETLDSNSEIYDDDGSGLAERFGSNTVYRHTVCHICLKIKSYGPYHMA